MANKTDILLFRYFENEMTPEEKSGFTALLKQDSSLQERFIRESMMRTVIHEWASAQIQPAVVFEGNVEISVMGREYSLPEGTTIIGRSDGADIIVESPKLSRSHARFIIENGTVSIEDLDSKNGTFVNHERIQERTKLALGDSVSFANIGCDISFPEISDFEEPESVTIPQESDPEEKPEPEQKTDPRTKASSFKESSLRNTNRRDTAILKMFAAAAAVILGAVFLFNVITPGSDTDESTTAEHHESRKPGISDEKRTEVKQRISGIIRDAEKGELTVSLAHEILTDLEQQYGNDFILGPSITAAYSEVEAQARLGKTRREEEALRAKLEEEEKQKEKEKQVLVQQKPEAVPEPEPEKKPLPEQKPEPETVVAWDRTKIDNELQRSEILARGRKYAQLEKLYTDMLANVKDGKTRSDIESRMKMNSLFAETKKCILDYAEKTGNFHVEGIGTVTGITADTITVSVDGTDMPLDWESIKENEFTELARKALPENPTEKLLIAQVWMSLQKRDFKCTEYYMSKAPGLSRVIKSDYPEIYSRMKKIEAELAEKEQEQKEKELEAKKNRCPRSHAKKQVYDNGRPVIKGLPEPPKIIAPMKPLDTSGSASVIGDGTPESITMDKIQAALVPGAMITFNTGGKPVTVEITQQLYMPATEKPEMTVIDGGGLVTFDGREKNRFLLKGWKNELTVQRCSFINCRAEKEGGAIKVENWDGRLFVIDCSFRNCKTTSTGPDIGGGAIRTTGQKEWMVSGCTFEDCAGSNGGAICDIGSPIIVVNSTFRNCRAFGFGGGADRGPTGQGGIGGALYNDGIDQAGGETIFYISGCLFRDNSAGDHAGAIFGYTRPEFRSKNLSIYNACIFENNTVDQPKTRGLGFAGAVYTQYSELHVLNCSFYRNSCPKLGPWLFVATKKPVYIKNCDVWSNRGQGGLPGHAKQEDVKTSREQTPPAVRYLGRMPGNPMDGK